MIGARRGGQKSNKAVRIWINIVEAVAEIAVRHRDDLPPGPDADNECLHSECRPLHKHGYLTPVIIHHQQTDIP